MPLPEASLRWILAHPGGTTVIPGARSAEQAKANAVAGDGAAPPAAFTAAVADVSSEQVGPHVSHRW